MAGVRGGPDPRPDAGHDGSRVRVGDAAAAPGRRHPLLPPARAGPAPQEEGTGAAAPAAAPAGPAADGPDGPVAAARGVPTTARPPAPGLLPGAVLVSSTAACRAPHHAPDSADGVASPGGGDPGARGARRPDGGVLTPPPPPPGGPQPGPAQGPGNGPAARPHPTPGARPSQRPQQPHPGCPPRTCRPRAAGAGPGRAGPSLPPLWRVVPTPGSG